MLGSDEPLPSISNGDPFPEGLSSDRIFATARDAMLSQRDDPDNPRFGVSGPNFITPSGPVSSNDLRVSLRDMQWTWRRFFGKPGLVEMVRRARGSRYWWRRLAYMKRHRPTLFYGMRPFTSRGEAQAVGRDPGSDDLVELLERND